jgi:ribonucleoside-diphosphate reductase beta chain
MSNIIFNTNNTAWQTGDYPLFFGQVPGVYDSVNVKYPKLFDLYEQLKQIDWRHDEIDLTQTRMDLHRCPFTLRDIMIKNLAYQWELDSIASRSIAPLLAPFITNSEYWLMIVKQSENENLHSLTYSEIIRQCLPDTTEIFNEVMKNEQVINRGSRISKVFSELKEIGAKFTLGLVSKEVAMPIVLKSVVTLYALERIEFMSSFACTFALAEQQLFVGAARLVQKIAEDEQIHTAMGKETIKIIKSNQLWNMILDINEDEIRSIIDDIVSAEYQWNSYLFSEGRNIVGLNEKLLNSWVQYNAQQVYETLSIDMPFTRVEENPLPWMNEWLDINLTQNANQEGENLAYTMITVVNDLNDEELEF